MKKIDFIWLSIILIAALLLRLYRADIPLSGFQSWPQAQSAILSEQYAKGEISLFSKNSLKSTFDSLSANPYGNQFTEFPIYPWINGISYKLSHEVPAHLLGRFLSIISSLIVISCIYYLILKEYSRPAAIASATVFTIFPFFILLSRLVLSDMFTLGLLFASLVAIYHFCNTKKFSMAYLVIGTICYALAVMIKPAALMFIAPFIYLFVKTYRFDVFKKWQLYLFLLGSIVPLIIWRIYIVQVYRELPSVTSLISIIQTTEGQKNVFFSLLFFRDLLVQRIGITILGVYMSTFAFFGLISHNKSYFIHSLAISSLIYLFTFQAGNLQYEYFQTFLLPTFAIMTGLGISFVIQNTKTMINPYIAYPLMTLLVVLSWLYSYTYVQKMYEFDTNQMQIAKLVNSFTESQDRIVTDTKGNPTLLYLSGREGTSLKTNNVEELKGKGYSYFVTGDMTEALHLKEKGYKILVENNQFWLIQL